MKDERKRTPDPFAGWIRGRWFCGLHYRMMRGYGHPRRRALRSALRCKQPVI